MLKISNLLVGLDNDKPVEVLAAKRFNIGLKHVKQVKIIRKAIDARRKHSIHFVYTLAVEVSDESGLLERFVADKDITIWEPANIPAIVPGTVRLKNRPVIVGAGPAGLIAGMILAENGYRPLLIERGKSVAERTKDILKFWQDRVLNSESNMQFGEGGAGTFSDGKLTTRINDPIIGKILEIFVAAGASPEILYDNNAHIGTDILRKVVSNISEKIRSLGGEIRFSCKMENIIFADNKVQGITLADGEEIPCETLLLAIGHSARDTYKALFTSGVAMTSKPFAIGLRIEHPQELIDRAQYGESFNHPQLRASNYNLSYQDKVNGRVCYSFCMCPGGQVVASSTEPYMVVTNGMSHYARNSGVANSAIVVNVDSRDFGDSVLGGIEFQRRYERLAFAVGGKNYSAPAQNVKSFLLKDKTPSIKSLVTPTYLPGLKAANLREFLPEIIGDTIADAIVSFDKKIKGFAHPEALLIGVETRTSAPVRIVRDTETRESANIAGLYPIGEGAGYAGGIMSASVDGYHSAVKIITKYSGGA